MYMEIRSADPGGDGFDENVIRPRLRWFRNVIDEQLTVSHNNCPHSYRLTFLEIVMLLGFKGQLSLDVRLKWIAVGA